MGSMDMEILPEMLVIDDEEVYRNLSVFWFEGGGFCKVHFAENAAKAEDVLREHKISIFLVDVFGHEFGKDLIEGYMVRFPDAFFCLWTNGLEKAYDKLDGKIKCFAKNESKNETVPMIMKAWEDHKKGKKNNTASQTIEVVGIEKQKDIEILNVRLKRNHEIDFECAALRHSDHYEQLNLSTTLGYGCRIKCSFCYTGELVGPGKCPLVFNALEQFHQVECLLECSISLGYQHQKVVISDHGGNDPRYCIDEYCGFIKMTREKLKGQDLRFIATSVGGGDTFKEIASCLSPCDSLELSANFAENKIRGIYMPGVARDSVEREVRILDLDSAESGRKNRYRILLFDGLNNTKEEAIRIANLLLGTSLSVIVTKPESVCLREYPNILTDEQACDFVRMLQDLGVQAKYNKNVGVGPVTCGRQINARIRKIFRK